MSRETASVRLLFRCAALGMASASCSCIHARDGVSPSTASERPLGGAVVGGDYLATATVQKYCTSIACRLAHEQGQRRILRPSGNQRIPMLQHTRRWPGTRWVLCPQVGQLTKQIRHLSGKLRWCGREHAFHRHFLAARRRSGYQRDPHDQWELRVGVRRVSSSEAAWRAHDQRLSLRKRSLGVRP